MYISHVANVLFRFTSFLSGLLAIYLAAFVYKRGRARIGNRLEDWWGVRRRDESPGRSFLRACSHSVEICLIRVYMEESFSIQWIILCASLPFFSCLGIYLGLAIPVRLGVAWFNPLILLRIMDDKELQSNVLPLLIAFPLTFVVAFIFKGFLWLTRSLWGPPRKLKELVSRETMDFRSGLINAWTSTRKVLPPGRIKFGLKSLVAISRIAIWGAIYALILISAAVTMGIAAVAVLFGGVPLLAAWFGLLGFLALRVVAPGVLKLSWIYIGLISAGGAVTGASFLVTMRWILECRYVRPWPFRKQALALISMVLLASLLFFGPLYFVSDTRGGLPLQKNEWLAVQNTPSSIARFLAYCNGIDILVAYGLLVVVLTLLAHRMVWPRLRTGIIALRLAGMGFNRGVLWGLGAAFLLLASGRFWDFVNAFMAHDPDYYYEKFEKLVHFLF